MRQVRAGVFETNSSSTHSLTIVSLEDYEAWQNGELVYDDWNDTLVKPEDCHKYAEKLSYEKYWENCYLESYEKKYTTKSGETVIAFGQYGYDG